MRTEFFLVLLASLSFALLDPPVSEVHDHNLDNVYDDVVHENLLNVSEREPTLNDPTTFFYLKALTLTPSVNNSINAEHHPYLIWLVAEDHERRIKETYDSGHCREWIERTYDDLEIVNVTAYYELDGLIEKEGNTTIFNTANVTETLADNETFRNGEDAKVPFEKGLWCQVVGIVSEFILGDMIDLGCYEESLAYASPYPQGVFNLTVRNLTVVNPRLNVTLKGDFRINYTERGERCSWDGEDCDCEGVDNEGSIPYSRSDFDSYEIQNDYITVIPYSPRFLNLSGPVSDEVFYHLSLHSNSDLYKYYSVIDEETASAYYLKTFEVVEDGAGIRHIIANETYHKGLLPEDPYELSNYSGNSSLLITEQDMALRNPYEINNQSYNYSRVYLIKDVIYNLTPGEHHVDLEFFTYFGNYTAESDITARYRTVLSIQAMAKEDGVHVQCSLKANNTGIAGQPVQFDVEGQKKTFTTNGNGTCEGIIQTNLTSGTVRAFYEGSGLYSPSSAEFPFMRTRSVDLGINFLGNNIGLLLLLCGLVAFSIMGLMQTVALGGPIAGSMGGLFLGGRKGQGKDKKKDLKKDDKKKKQKKIEDRKKASEKKKGRGEGLPAAGYGKDEEKKGTKEKKDDYYEERKKIAKKEESEKQIAAGPPPGKPDDDDKKVRRVTEEEIAVNRRRYAGTYEMKERYLDNNEVHQAYAQELRGRIQDTHVREIKERVENTCKALGNAKYFEEFVESSRELELKIIPDRNINQFLEKHGERYPDRTLAFTIDNTVYIRESGMNDERYIQQVIRHENYHPFSKIAYNTDSRKAMVEGFNEIMRYEDILKNKTVPDEIKSDTRIIEGIYRYYAEQQYLMREIIGKDEYIIGHLVKGEKHLQDKFDSIAGNDAFKNIFLREHDPKIMENLKSDDDQMRYMLEVEKSKIEDLKAILIDVYSKNGKSVKEISSVIFEADNIPLGGFYEL